MELGDRFKCLFVLLDDSTPSMCYYKKKSADINIMSLEIFRKAISFSESNSLNLNIIGNMDLLSKEYRDCLHEMPFVNLKGFKLGEYYTEKDLVILEKDMTEDFSYTCDNRITHLIAHFSIDKLDGMYPFIENNYKVFKRLSIIFDGIEEADEVELNNLRLFFNKNYKLLKWLLLERKDAEIGFAFDRIVLKEMHNCEAGIAHLTLAPNGQFYICPGFYYDSDLPVGTIDSGISIPNKQLLEYKNAPICNKCDCFQCKRCVYLNKHMTLEINIPSHNQCVISHHERNLSGMLLCDLQKEGYLLDMPSISPLFYLDPIDLIMKNFRG